MANRKPQFEDIQGTDAHKDALHKLNLLENLYEIRVPGDIGEGNSYLSIITHNSRSKRKWNYFPSKRQKKCPWNLEYDQELLSAQIITDLAVGDSRWAIGGSKRDHSVSPVLQFELDYEIEPGCIADDEFAFDRLNMPLYSFLKSKGLVSHILLSGNRSVYVAFYVKNPIKKETWKLFFEAIRRILLLGGINDADLLKGAGLRYPLSRHQGTGGLCRYLGNLSEEDLVNSLSSIKKDDISDEQLLEIAELVLEMDFLSGTKYPMSGTKAELDLEQKKPNKKIIKSIQKPLWEDADPDLLPDMQDTGDAGSGVKSFL